MSSLSEDQQEILALLSAELEELSQLGCMALTGQNGNNLELHEYLGPVNNLANAALLAGLSGFHNICLHLADNLLAITNANQSPEPLLLDALLEWPNNYLNYINAIGQSNALEKAAIVLDLLAKPCWPKPLTGAARSTTLSLFTDQQIIEPKTPNQWPEKSDAVMTSLEIPPDVRQELVDGMTVELPVQVTAFEESINAYLGTHAFEDLNQAQRMAHTLKGAANIVGVAGIANLMHFIEDLLELGLKKWQSPPDGFDDLLLNCSDCLAVMAEHVCGLGPEPEDSRSIMDTVLAWLRSTHDDTNHTETGLLAKPSIDEPTAAPSTTLLQDTAATTTLFNQTLDANVAHALDPPKLASLTPSVQTAAENTLKPSADTAPAEDKDTVDDKHFIHVPETSATELLRIAGESQIVNTQLAAQIESLQTSVALASRYHQYIRQMASELEVIVQTQNAVRSAASKGGESLLDPLEMERYSELYSFSNQLLELTADSQDAITQIDGQISDLNNLNYLQKQNNRQNQTLLLDIRLMPVGTLSARFSRCVRQASRLTGKAAQLTIEGEDVLLDSRVLNRIASPIMHLLRNAVDHGLESSANIREQANKSTAGNITLSFAHTGETITITCNDDGSGLDYPAITQSAVDKGLIQANQPSDETLLNQIILMPGFSTRTNASQTSGRGIGLDAVASEVRALKGNISIDSTAGVGCTFTLVVPTSIISAHAVLIPCTGNSGAIMNAVVTRNIEQIIFIQPEDRLIENGAPFYVFNDEKIAILEFNHLANLHNATSRENTALLVTTRADGQRVGIAVEGILASQDMVIKPLNNFTYHPEGVVGATILGDGNVAPVIDLQDLPGMALNHDEYQRIRAQREKIEAMDAAAQKDAPIALIVDDSLSARRSLAQFVQDIGMEVRTAKDGFEAITALDAKKPTLMLVDLEMPKMNGLELTAHIRSREDTKDIPVIMITSRATDKHKQLAARAGVNSYLNKPWTDEDLMASIERQMLH